MRNDESNHQFTIEYELCISVVHWWCRFAQKTSKSLEMSLAWVEDVSLLADQIIKYARTLSARRPHRARTTHKPGLFE